MVQQLGRGWRVSGGKGFLNAIVHVGAHVSEASLVKANVDNAFLAGFGICESLTSNLLYRSRRGHHVWASPKICPCACVLWIEIGIFVDRPHCDVNEKYCLDVVAESESVIDSLKWSRSNRRLSMMILKVTFGVANLRRCSFACVRELRR